ncbi:hypothetical protein [Prosthecobacter sp.]|uniref:hypothetical protein n=1 Tax=Prosthecobacter sp. TaxID=1965333 RepID=UPI001D3AB087|nr:hypothetical protein [Prosthecobacter sp.]MCB1278797.1 hypothetical protein [Prosthecobacter sp.]
MLCTMNPLETAIEWRDGHEIHYCAQSNSAAPKAGPVVIYEPLSQQARTFNFLPCSGLFDRNSPDFEPRARLVSGGGLWPTDRFIVVPEGIRTSNPHLTGLFGVIDHLRRTDGLEHVCRQVEPPSLRWENLDIEEIKPTSALQDYCNALGQEYRNGFVESRTYQINDNALGISLIAKKRQPWIPTQFLEIMRHEDIVNQFGISERQDQVLIRPINWQYYSAFLLSGFFAQTLARGGAYSPSPITAERIDDAKRLGDSVFASFKDAHTDLEFYACDKPWCSRHGAIAWDLTWVILQPKARLLTLIMATDTD